MPFSQVIIPLFLLLIFLSVVTACNSNMTAMAGISTQGITPDSPEAPAWLKIAWGVIVMTLAYIMIATVGVNGVKIIAKFRRHVCGDHYAWNDNQLRDSDI